MAWSSYAHLPNGEEEYWKILSGLENELSVLEVDRIIAMVKRKEKVSHHYRSNLAKVGLFDIRDGKVSLNYDVAVLKKKKSYLKKVLLEAILHCDSMEIDMVKTIVWQKRTYDLEKIVECLRESYPELEKNNLIRWIRPIVKLLKIVDILEQKEKTAQEGAIEKRQYEKALKENDYKKFLQEAYLKLAKEFGKAIALEEIDEELKKIERSYDIVFFLEELLVGGKGKFKMELLMMPTWATKSIVYKVSGDYYTHLRIKSELI